MITAIMTGETPEELIAQIRGADIVKIVTTVNTEAELQEAI